MARVEMGPDRAGGAREHDEAFMRQALRLAARGVGHVNPNPLVGAVIVRDGRVIGQGWHACCGREHAECAALADCAARGESPRGASVYVTLEPCAHFGRQPPCADALVEAELARVVVGSADPNPLVAGKGLARLQQAGIEVVPDVLRAECDAVNQVFFHYITTKTPYLLAKWAATADGRIACRTGQARWVSGGASRADAHALRNRLAAVMVGVGTVLADDPALTCRLEGGRNPLRVVCDTELAIPLDSALVRSAAAGEAGLLVACGCPSPAGEAPVSGRTQGAGMPQGAAGHPQRGFGELAEGLGLEFAALSEEVNPSDSGLTQGRAAPSAGLRPRPTAPMPARAWDPAAREERAERLRELGVEVLELPCDASGHVDLRALMAALGRRGVDSVLLEGGARLHGSAFVCGVVNEAVAYVAPKLLGDASAPGPVAGRAPLAMDQAVLLGRPHVDGLGDDVRIAWRVCDAAGPSGAGELPCVACGPLYPGGATTAETAEAAREDLRAAGRAGE